MQQKTDLERRYTTILVVTTGTLVAYSLLIQYLAINAGLGDIPKGIGNLPYKGYSDFGNINWRGYPIFFPAVAALVYLSFVPFLRAWRDMVDEGVIVDETKTLSAKEIKQRVTESLGRMAWICILAAVVAAGALLFVERANDKKSVWAKDLPVREQVERACADPDYWEKSLFDQSPGLCLCIAQDTGTGVTCYANLSKVPSTRFDLTKNTCLYFVVQSQMLFIGILGMLVLLQIAAHILLFAFFDRLGARKHNPLVIRLNWQSPLAEFGMHYWNHALNNVYWGFSIALFVPIASRFSQRGTELDSGQIILSLAVTLLVVGPIAATIIVRQMRLPAVWQSLQAEMAGRSEKEKQALMKSYHAQRLWPFDKNVSTKMGIIVALALLGYIALFNLAAFA